MEPQATGEIVQDLLDQMVNVGMNDAITNFLVNNWIVLLLFVVYTILKQVAARSENTLDDSIVGLLDSVMSRLFFKKKS